TTCAALLRAAKPRRGRPATFIGAWAAAPNAAGAPVPSAASWTRRSVAPPAVRPPAANPDPFHLSPIKIRARAPPFRVCGNGYNRLSRAPTRRRTLAQEDDDERRAWSPRFPQQGAAARAHGNQPVLAALPAARQLGLQVAGQAMAQGIDRG